MLLKDKLKNKNLILASKSPRRRDLMQGCGFKFTVADGYPVEEIYPADMPVEQVPEFLARLKADAYPFELTEDDILITADTVVVLDGRILGKPADRADAVRMILEMSGNRHTVVSGVCLKNRVHDHSFSAHTDVWMREITRPEAEYYVDTYRPYDKAGAYGIQEWIGYAAVSRIEGSFYNVMGLPIQALYVALDQFANK